MFVKTKLISLFQYIIIIYNKLVELGRCYPAILYYNSMEMNKLIFSSTLTDK